MKFADVMAELKRLGTAQNVKIYQRHGAGENVFGVSFANLGAIKKRIKVDRALAEQLWETGNSDARTLAIMIADAETITASWAEKWLTEIDYYGLADMYAGLIARSPVWLTKMKKWMTSKKEYTRQVGYVMLAMRLRDEAGSVSDELCAQVLETIETEVHKSPNRARHAMLMTLIAIGIYKPTLKTKAVAAARRIGKVEVDHGETGCKTPDAVAYIEKALARKKSQKR